MKESIEAKVEDVVEVMKEVTEAENLLEFTCINIFCKNIRELHCGDRIIF
jgi:hypothetical protein